MAVCAAAVVVAYPTASHAASKEKSKGAKSRASPTTRDPQTLGPEDPVMVLLVPLLAPVGKKAAAGELLPVSVFVGVRGLSGMQSVCSAAPQLRDAIVSLLYDHPIPMGKDGPDPAALNKPLVEAVNRSVPAVAARDVSLIPSYQVAVPGYERALPYPSVVACAIKPEGKKDKGKEKGKESGKGKEKGGH